MASEPSPIGLRGAGYDDQENNNDSYRDTNGGLREK